MNTEKPKNQPYELTPGGERALFALRKVFHYSRSHLNLLGQIDRTSHEASLLFLATLIGTRIDENTPLRKVVKILESIFVDDHPETFTLEDTNFLLRIQHKSKVSSNYNTSLEIGIINEDKLVPQISIGIALSEVRITISNILNPPKTNSTAKGASRSSHSGVTYSEER